MVKGRKCCAGASIRLVLFGFTRPSVVGVRTAPTRRRQWAGLYLYTLHRTFYT